MQVLKTYILIISVLTSLVSYGQQNTIINNPAKGLSAYTLIRCGAGVQKSFYTDIGISRMNTDVPAFRAVSRQYYASFEWMPTILPDKEDNIFGIKAGYESSAQIFTTAIEIKYLTDNTFNDFVITPKIGVCFFRFGIFYGYNISLKTPINYTGHHQFSIKRYFGSRLLNRGKL